MALNVKQQRFIEEYVIDLNATQAAIRAGYSKKTAHSQGPRLLENVEISEAIAEMKAQSIERTKINADYVLRRLVAIDQMQVNDIIDECDNIKPINKWPKVWLQTLSAFDIAEIKEKGRKAGVLKKIKLPDKIKNLELLGKHISVKAFSEQFNVNANVTHEDALAALEDDDD